MVSRESHKLQLAVQLRHPQPHMVKWQSGPMQVTANLYNRWFESSLHLQVFRSGIMALHRSPKPQIGVRFPGPEPHAGFVKWYYPSLPS